MYLVDNCPEIWILPLVASVEVDGHEENRATLPSSDADKLRIGDLLVWVREGEALICGVWELERSDADPTQVTLVINKYRIRGRNCFSEDVWKALGAQSTKSITEASAVVRYEVISSFGTTLLRVGDDLMQFLSRNRSVTSRLGSLYHRSLLLRRLCRSESTARFLFPGHSILKWFYTRPPFQLWGAITVAALLFLIYPAKEIGIGNIPHVNFLGADGLPKGTTIYYGDNHGFIMSPSWSFLYLVLLPIIFGLLSKVAHHAYYGLNLISDPKIAIIVPSDPHKRVSAATQDDFIRRFSERLASLRPKVWILAFALAAAVTGCDARNGLVGATKDWDAHQYDAGFAPSWLVYYRFEPQYEHLQSIKSEAQDKIDSLRRQDEERAARALQSKERSTNAELLHVPEEVVPLSPVQVFKETQPTPVEIVPQKTPILDSKSSPPGATTVSSDQRGIAEATVAYANFYRKPPTRLLNLLFDGWAYLWEFAALFLISAFAIKFYQFVSVFNDLALRREAPFQFKPLVHDIHNRLGLHPLGLMFTGFLGATILFQLHVLILRIEQISHVTHEPWFSYPDYIWTTWVNLKKDSSNPLHSLISEKMLGFNGLGVADTKIFLVLASVVTIMIAVFPLLQLKRYVERCRDMTWKELARSYEDQVERNSPRAAKLRTKLLALKDADTWPNGESTAYKLLFVSAALLIGAWAPPLLIGLAVMGALVSAYSWLAKFVVTRTAPPPEKA